MRRQSRPFTIEIGTPIGMLRPVVLEVAPMASAFTGRPMARIPRIQEDEREEDK